MKNVLLSFLTLVALLSCTAITSAAIVYSGGVGDSINIPSDPNGWDANTEAYIGLGTEGEITVSPSSTMLSNIAHIGYNVGVAGTVTVNGTGSAWSNSSDLLVGSYGSGTLDILNGGAVTCGASVNIGKETGSTGTMTVDASNLTASSNLVAGEYGTGTLTIQNGANVSSNQGRIAYRDGSNGMALISNATWTNSGNFMVGVIGTSTGELTINAGGQVSNIGGGAIAYDTNAKGTVTVTGSGSQWNIGDYFQVGRKGTAILNITDGAAVNVTGSSESRIAEYAGSKGDVLVTGSGSQWNNSQQLNIGHYGTGSLRIETGATVTSAGASLAYNSTGSGSVEVDGGQWNNTTGMLTIGRHASGTLDISNGGIVTNTAACRIGVYSDGTGAVNVTGSQSQWNNSDYLHIGSLGTGSLTISDGASVNCVGGRIGRYAGGNGTLTVTGNGSSFTMERMSCVGEEGVGILNIYNNAEVFAPHDLYVDFDQSGNSSGTINFDNGTLHAGGLCTNFNNLTGSGTIYASGMIANMDLTFDSTTGLSQTISGVGANEGITLYLDAGGDAAYGENGWTVMGAGYDGTGSLNINDGVTLATSSGVLAFHSTATATALVSGEGSAWTLTQSLKVGRNGAATLEITDAGLVAVNGYLGIDDDIEQEISGAIADSYINMSNGGMLAIYAGLEEGEEFDPANLGTLVGGSGIEHIQWWNETISDWASITTATLGTDYTLDYITEDELAGFVLLTVGGEITPEYIPGDANNDGKVDGSDVTILAGNWQVLSGATWSMGDFNGDKKVDGSDVTILAGNWQYGISTAAVSVPEPGIPLLLLVTFVTLFAGYCVRRN